MPTESQQCLTRKALRHAWYRILRGCYGVPQKRRNSWNRRPLSSPPYEIGKVAFEATRLSAPKITGMMLPGRLIDRRPALLRFPRRSLRELAGPERPIASERPARKLRSSRGAEEQIERRTIYVRGDR